MKFIKIMLVHGSSEFADGGTSRTSPAQAVDRGEKSKGGKRTAIYLC